jgi:hypothetical protein
MSNPGEDGKALEGKLAIVLLIMMCLQWVSVVLNNRLSCVELSAIETLPMALSNSDFPMRQQY